MGLGLIAFTLFIYFWPAFKSTVYPALEPTVTTYGGSKVFARMVPTFVSTYFTTHKDLYDRNVQLEKEIERLENKVAEQDALIRESGFVHDASVSANASVIALYPLMEDKTKLYSTIILSKGYKDGIQKDALVFVRGMQPACQIIEVYDKTSLCELFSKSGRVTEAVTGSSTLTLSLTGNGGGDFIAELPKGTEISPGENVYLRSNPAYVLGTVVLVKDDDQATGVRVYVRGAYNPVTSSVFYMNATYAH